MNIGIDLGTFNSAAAVTLGRDNVMMIENKLGESPYGKNFPSFVQFDHNGQKQAVGMLAKSWQVRNPKLVIWGVKRLIGLSYDEAVRRGELKRFQYDIEKGPGGGILIKVGEERYAPSQILEYILLEIKEDTMNPRVNGWATGKLEKVVISVPAYFDATRITPIKEAAKNVGFNEVETIKEPTAAAIVYGLKLDKDAKILTFDLGAGTLDVTIMLLLNEGGNIIPGELCTSGNEALGGIDMDDMLKSYIIKKYELSEMENDPRFISILKNEIELMKIELSFRESASRNFPDKKLVVDLTRKELEEVLKPLLEKCRGPIRVALDQANLKANQLDHVLLVGGPVYMPCVRATIKDELKKLGAKIELLQELEIWEQKGVNPMECVAQGASLSAGGFVKIYDIKDPNGYGTICWPVPGFADYFYSIIPVNSSYPIKRVMGIQSLNPKALRVQIPLVKKLAYNESGHTMYRYYRLGEYDCYIKSTGESPLIDITMELNSDKDLITTFTHRQTRESVRFEKLDELKGEEISLQEDKQPDVLPGPGNGGPVGPVGSGDVGGWSQKQLDDAKHVAQMLVDDFAEHSQDKKVTNKKIELLGLIQESKEPNDTRFIIRRVQELLNLLKNASNISESEFLKHLESLRKIEQSN